jgi:hypothetical protein
MAEGRGGALHDAGFQEGESGAWAAAAAAAERDRRVGVGVVGVAEPLRTEFRGSSQRSGRRCTNVMNGTIIVPASSSVLMASHSSPSLIGAPSSSRVLNKIPSTSSRPCLAFNLLSATYWP